MEHQSFTVWFTGITRSGKSTLAKMLKQKLLNLGLHAELLDSGEIRRELNPDLGFTKDDVARSMNRLAYECRLLNRNNVVAIASAVSPYNDLRAQMRGQIDTFVEVFCDASVDEVIERDPDNLLARARRGEVRNVAGVDAPYEPPDQAEVHLKTAQSTPDECLELIVKTLSVLQLIPKEESGYTVIEEEMIKTRLRDLGYI